MKKTRRRRAKKARHQSKAGFFIRRTLPAGGE
jgi:hypothetical protein